MFGGCSFGLKLDILQEAELTEEFKANYEKWLQREVYNTQIDWGQLLVRSYD